MKRLSLQNRIAFSVIISTAMLIMILCSIILLTFKVHLDKLSLHTEITLEDVKYLFVILLRVCTIGCFFVFLFLFTLSRRIARDGTKPIRKIINTANSITHNNLGARIPLPARKDELYELSETINKLLDRIEYALEREKSFTSYASHEFRTPLSVLKGTMEVLLRKPRSDEEYREKINACVKEVDKMNEMVEQLLILTRYEGGKSSLNYDHYLLEDLINNSVCIFADAILSKKLEISTQVEPVGRTIYTDEYSFSTILNNLISNAVKYSNDKGEIDIRAFQQGEELIVEIKNTGYGISKEELDLIFDKFYRSYAFEGTKIKGFGLGLPIVKRFCDLLNIKITIDSEINDYTVARLIIPLR